MIDTSNGLALTTTVLNSTQSVLLFLFQVYDFEKCVLHVPVPGRFPFCRKNHFFNRTLLYDNFPL